MNRTSGSSSALAQAMYAVAAPLPRGCYNYRVYIPVNERINDRGYEQFQSRKMRKYTEIKEKHVRP